MRLILFSKIKKVVLRPEVLFFLGVAVFVATYVYILFGNAEFLASGDNYTYLQLRIKDFNFYTWGRSIPLGEVNYTMPDLLGIPLYSIIFGFLSPQIIQRLLIFCLLFLKVVGFYKLAKLISRRFSLFAMVPVVLIFLFNAFESLNPFSFFPLMYGVYILFSLYYFIKLLESKNRNFLGIIKLLVLSVIFSPINSNPALSLTIFIPQFLYLLFVLLRKREKPIYFNVFAYFLLLLLVNLWWAFPILLYFIKSSARVFSTGWFSAVNVGTLHENFRFIGQWGWYGKHFLHYYYPFSAYYDNPIVILSGYLLFIFVLFTAFKRNNSKYSFNSFFLLFILIALFLIGGARPPFGVIYEFLFRYFPGLKIFREPFTKFGELYVLSFSMLFYLSLLDIEKYFRSMRRLVVFAFIIFLVLVNVKPVLLGEHVWNKWNGSVRTSRINVPSYWKDFQIFQNVNLQDSRILVTPKSYYGGAWNWIDGFSSADDVAVNFVDRGNSILRNPINSGSDAGEVIDNIFRVVNLPKNYLSLLSVDYILQENDLDWRYSGDLTLPPLENEDFIKNLGVEKIKEFGEFTSDYLTKIPNGEPNKPLRDEMSTELNGKPNLVLYKVTNENKLSMFYVPSSLVYTFSTIQDLPYVLQVSNFSKGTGIVIDEPKNPKAFFSEDLDIVIVGTRRFSRFSPDRLTWNNGWSWPVTVNTSPNELKYIFVLLKENIEKLFPRNSLDKADLLLWLSAKRVSEITKYELTPRIEEKLIADYADLVSRTINQIESISEKERKDENGNEDDYWGMVGKVLMYLERCNSTLPLSNHTFNDNNKDPRILYEEFVSWIYDVATPVCGKYCYSFKVPKDGKYEVYLGNVDPSKSDLSDSKVLGLDFIGNEGPKNEIPNWYYKGSTNLWKKETSYIVNLVLPEPVNLVDSNEWLVPSTTVSNNNNIDFVISDTFSGYNAINLKTLVKDDSEFSLVLWKETLRYKPIKNFVGGKNYEISFEYSAGSGGLGVALIESNSPIPDQLSYSQLLSTKTLLKTELNSSCLGKQLESECWLKYSKTIRASNTSKSALLFMYAYPVLGGVSHVELKNLKVQEVLDPILAIKSSLSDDIPNTTNLKNPNISYTKINPTKYKISVSGAKNTYNLVFSETYDNWWRLYLNGTTPVAKDSHYKVNGYANMWNIEPKDVNDSEDYELILEFFPQRIFYGCVFLGGFTLLVCFFYLFINMIKSIKHDKLQ